MSSASYSLLNPGRIVAGEGSLAAIAEMAAEYKAKRVVIITDQGVWNAGLVDKPKELLEAAGIAVEVIKDTPPEPATQHVNGIFAVAKGLACDMVVGIGGGSAMDVAKIIAVMLTNDLSLRQLLDKAKITCPGKPLLMVPTTAGTGSEATPNAIVLVEEENMKVGIVSEKFMPQCVILDPLMTIKLPPAVTAATGMDALTHAVECFMSKKGNVFSETFALKAIELIARSLRRAYRVGSDVAARQDMLLGALFGGMSIATSSTTAVHALAYPLGGKYRIPHGLSNAILLPHVMAFNMEGAEEKFRQVAVAMNLPVQGLSDKDAAQKVIEELYALIDDLDLNVNLRDKGISEADLDSMVESAAQVTRLLDNNPRPMTREDMRNIYLKLL